MKRWFGKLVYDFVRKYLVYLDKEIFLQLLDQVNYSRMLRSNMDLTHFSELKPLPNATGQKQIVMYRTKALDNTDINDV